MEFTAREKMSVICAALRSTFGVIEGHESGYHRLLCVW